MGYYGIADAADQFSRTRNKDLMSGEDAYDKMTKSFMDAYKVPEQMVGSDANALNNSIRFDTLNQGYGDMVDTGRNAAASTALSSGINLHKLDADNQIQTLRAQAAQQGITSPLDVAKYISDNLDSARVAANPYLRNAATDYQRITGQQTTNLGAGLGGTVGTNLETAGLAAQGYGINATLDENGNIVYTDAAGNRSLPFSRGGAVPSAAAFGGNVDPLAQYGLHLETVAAQNQYRNEQLAQRDRADRMRYGNAGGAGNTRALQAQLSTYQRIYTTQMSKGDRVGAAQTMQAMQAIMGQMQGEGGGPQPGHSGTPGMNAITGGGGVPGVAPTGAPTVTSALGAPVTGTTPNVFWPDGNTTPTAPAAAPVPSVGATAPAAQVAQTMAAEPAAPAPAADPQTDVNAATADVSRLSAAIRDLDRNAGPMTVYGPTNAPPGYGLAREEMVRRLAAAQSRLSDAQDRLRTQRTIAAQQAANARAAQQQASQQADVQRLLSQYLGGR